MSSALYQNDDWALIHLYTTGNERNKALFFNDKYKDGIKIDLTKTIGNMFYVSIKGRDIVASESPMDIDYSFVAHIHINDDDAILTLPGQDKIILSRCHYCS